MIKLCPPLFLLFLAMQVSSQNISGVINAYTPVTAINYCNNAVIVGSSAAFAVGDEALIIEMKGAVIDTSNTSTFGTILSYGDAGNYEFVHLASIAGNNITFTDKLLNQYDPNSAVQLIEVPQYANPTVNAVLTCQAWNGSTGGVLVLDVSGTLTLSANMDVSGLGFRGGNVSNNAVTCHVQDYVLPISSGVAYKGEGIVVYSNVNGGKGNLADGGGGANLENAGGAGGGNYGAGGNGGDGCQGCCGTSAGTGGIGGSALNYTSNLLFPGGGGGGGQQNQSASTPGGNGGGIVIVKGGQITASGAVSILATGNTAASLTTGSNSDGVGGGGAGGVVALSATGITGSTITVNVSGGAGGNNSLGADGPGGGAGGGAILLSNASLQSAITPVYAGGAAGYNSSTNSYRNAGPGQPGAVITNLALVAGTVPWQAIDTPIIASGSPVCAGQTVQFTVTGNYTIGDTFNWTGPNGFISNLRNPSVANATAANSGTYTLIVSDSGCSTPPVNSIVVVNPVYTDTINVALCPAASYVLPNGNVVAAAGTYSTVLQSISGCDSTIITNISAAPVNVVATGTASVCRGQSTQLNASGGGLGYTWTPSSGLSDSAIANPVASPTATTTYTVSSPVTFGNLIINGDFSQGNIYFTSGYTYTNPPNTNEGQYWVGTNASTWNGGMTSCGDHTTGTGNILFVNGATVANVSVWCETVNVTPNTTYDFSAWVSTLTTGNLAQLQFSVNGALLGSPYAAPASTCVWQQFYATWNSGNNTTADICVLDQSTVAGANDFALDDISFAQVCTGIDSVTITVYPNYSDTVNASICQNSSYTLPNGTIVSTAGTYIDTLATVNGCDSIITTNVTVNPVPHTVVFDTICLGTSLPLPSGGSTNASGVYIDTLATVLGCDSIITVNVYVTPPPVNVEFDTICQGNTFIRPSGISETSAGIYTDTLKTSGGCDSVVISTLSVNPTSAISVNDTICKGSSFTLPNGSSETTAGSYPVTLTNVYGCDSVVTTVLTVISDSITVNETDALCNGDSSGSLQAQASRGLSPYEYVLTENGIAVDSNGSGNFQNYGAGSYLVNVTDNFGCTATGSTSIHQPLALQLTIDTVDVTCYDAHNGTVSFTATGGAGPYNFTMDGQTNSGGSFTGLAPGIFDYTISDTHHCSDTGSVSVSQPQAVTISIAPDTAVISLGHSIQLNASCNYTTGANYQWSPDIGLSCTQCPNPIVATNSSQVYTVSVTVNIKGNDCDADTSILVTVVPNYDLYIPNVFAPGNNGPNSVFNVFGNLPAVAFFAIQIFDRWGERVYQSNDVYFQWDGTYKGKQLPQQVLSYTMQVTFEDSHSEKLFTGTVTLLR